MKSALLVIGQEKERERVLAALSAQERKEREEEIRKEIQDKNEDTVSNLLLTRHISTLSNSSRATSSHFFSADVQTRDLSFRPNLINKNTKTSIHYNSSSSLVYRYLH